ncbi:MAG: YfhO family protein [Janthinobacterium lividum]
MPFLFLAALPCLLLWPVVFGSDVFLPADLLKDIAPWRTADPKSTVPWIPLQWDGMAEFYPWRLFTAQTLKLGYLPLWNPHQFCGTPFVANSQSAVFYPLNLLFCIFPVAHAFGVSVLLHLFLTGSFMYGFLRSRTMALARPAALLGAVTWQLCHWQVAWLFLPTFLCVSAWLPLALLLVDKAAERPTALRAAGLGLVLGMMLLAGHLQIAFYCFGLITAYAVFRVLSRAKLHWKPLLGAAVLALALAFGLAAPQILPSVELARMSHRAGSTVNWAAYIIYVRLAVPPVNLITLFAPGFFGSPTRGTYWGVDTNGGPGAYLEYACYVGVLPLLLAVVGLLSTWRTQTATRFFSIAALVSLLLALGTALDAVLFFGIPGFSQTGSPGRILVLWSFCLPVLAAIGTDALLKRYDLHLLRNAALAFGASAALICIFAILWINHRAPAGTLSAKLTGESDLWRLPVGVLFGAAAAFWFWRQGSFTASRLGGALVVLTAVDLLAAGYGFNRTSAPQAVYPVTPLIAFLQQHKTEGRIMPINKQGGYYSPPPAILPPNSAMVYGLDDTQGYDSLLTGQYLQFASAMDSGSPAPPENGNMVFTYGFGSPQAREAGARFAVSLHPLPGLTPVYQDSTAYVYEDTKALPRVRTVAGIGLAAFNSAPTRLAIKLPDGSESRQIIVADQWYPGWNAYAAGKPISVTRGPDIFRTVTLDAGQSSSAVEMQYEPTAFRVGLYALCLALGTAAAIIAAAGTMKLGRGRLG